MKCLCPVVGWGEDPVSICNGMECGRFMDQLLGEEWRDSMVHMWEGIRVPKTHL